MSYTQGHANLQQTDRLSDELKTITLVEQGANCVTWNEARDAKKPLDALLGWDSVVTRGLGLSWETAKFSKIESGHETVMAGGRRGAGAHRSDNRRRGPSRGVLWVVLRETATGLPVIVATHHSIAKADTSAKWRRALRSQGWAGVVRELRAVQRKHPGARLILTGDFNARGSITAFAGLGVREVKTPATFGRNRYDRLFANGSVSNVRTLRTRSDHKALLATVTLTGDPVPPVDPPPAPPEVPMAWRPARSLDVLLAEVNAHAPKRSKASDGTVASDAHSQQNPTSDHEVNMAGVVRARDITHDPRHGCDAGEIAEGVRRLLGKHPALGSGAYVIYNRRIISTDRLGEGWRPYTRSNPHTTHVHVSVGRSTYDSTKPWGIFAEPEPEPTPYDKLHAAVKAALEEYGDDVQPRFKARRRFVDGLAALLKEAPAPTPRKART